MKLNAPKFTTLLLSVLIAIIGLISHFVQIPLLTALNFWIVLASFVLLALATIMPGL